MSINILVLRYLFYCKWGLRSRSSHVRLDKAKTIWESVNISELTGCKHARVQPIHRIHYAIRSDESRFTTKLVTGTSTKIVMII